MAQPTPLTLPQNLGNYELLQEVGVGGMGTVYRARHRETQDIVAVKVMGPEVAKNPVYLKRFEQEFRVASRLNHPNIVRALEYNNEGASPYLVMEFVEGESVGEKLEREKRIPEAEAVNLIVQAADGLHRAHQLGLIHRDIKPDNIMVTTDGRAKITDLGLVKEREATADLTRPGIGLGTPNFMAPEQFKNAKNASVRCDVYSLAATLYQMVTGELPFKGKDVIQAMMMKMKDELPPPRKVVPALSERLDAAVRRAMRADANQRPGSCPEFIADLTGDGPLPGVPSAAPPPARAAAPAPASVPKINVAPTSADDENSFSQQAVFVIFVILMVAVAGAAYFLIQ